MLRKHTNAHDSNEKEEESFHGFHYYSVHQTRQDKRRLGTPIFHSRLWLKSPRFG